MKQRWKRYLTVIGVVAATLGLAAWVILTFILVRPPDFHPTIQIGQVELRGWEDHDAIYRKAEFPYWLKLQTRSGALAYAGALHTNDAEAPQLKAIESEWKSFQPTVALCEGRSRMSRLASRNTTGHLSESELVRILAYQNNVPLYTLEPPYRVEVSRLLESYDPRDVALYLTLRVYVGEASGVVASARDDLARGLLAKRTDVDGLRGLFSSLEDLDQYWKQQYPDAGDWRELSETETVPRLRDIGDASRQIRGEHMVRSITELVRNGERVFAVVGASHVIRQEPTLTRLLTPDIVDK